MGILIVGSAEYANGWISIISVFLVIKIIFVVERRSIDRFGSI